MVCLFNGAASINHYASSYGKMNREFGRDGHITSVHVVSARHTLWFVTLRDEELNLMTLTCNAQHHDAKTSAQNVTF